MTQQQALDVAPVSSTTGVAGSELGGSENAAGRISTPGRPRPGALLFEMRVFGTPAPAGSKHAFRNQYTGRIQQVESSKKVKPWREAVKHAAIDAIGAREGTGDCFAILGEAVCIDTTYVLPRPKGHYRTGRNAHLLRDAAPLFPFGKPDVEKLDRSTRDALTDASVWVDDSRVVWHRSVKVYADDGLRVGALIGIYTAVRAG